MSTSQLPPARLACADARHVLIVTALICASCGARSSLELDDRGAEALPPAAPQQFACDPSDEDRPMLAARIEDRLVFAYRDRSARDVFRFDVPPNGYVSGGAQVISRGDRVAAYVIVAPLGPDSTLEPYAELVVVNVQGEVQYFARFEFAYEGWGSDSALFGSADGLFVLSLMEVQTGLGVIVDGDAAMTFTQKMAGRSDPDGLGRMVVADYEASSSAAFHFFDVRAGAFASSRYWVESQAGEAASSPAVVDEGLLYIAREPDRLVFERADGTSELPFADALDPGDYPSPGFSHSGGWALFLLGGPSPEEARYLAVRFATGEVRALMLAPPDPWRLPEDFWNPPAIDSFGRVVLPLSDGQRYQAFATIDGTTFEPLGRPITAAGYPATLVEAGGAIVFDGYGGGSEPAPGALPSHAAQLVGPQGGEGVELVRDDLQGEPDNPTYAADVLSADGRCLAYFKNGSLNVVETASYAQSDLGLVVSTQSAEVAWIALLR